MDFALRQDNDISNYLQEKNISFNSGEGKIFGQIVLPKNDAKDIGIVYLHGWGGDRNGPQNLLTDFSRKTAEKGYPGIRFDFRGRGISSDLDEVALAHMSEDCINAVQFFKKECGLRKIILIGLCSGGNVGIGSLDRLEGISQCILLSVFPFGNQDHFSRGVSRTGFFLREYFFKLFQKQTWLKFFRGEIYVVNILKVLFGHYKKTEKNKENKEQNKQSNPLNNLLKEKPKISMFYGDADPESSASMIYFKNFFDENQLEYNVKMIKNANHNFYKADWREILFAEILK